MSKRTITIIAVVFVLIALTQEPTRSADLVGQAWDATVDGTTSFMEGFFDFMDRLT